VNGSEDGAEESGDLNSALMALSRVVRMRFAAAIGQPPVGGAVLSCGQPGTGLSSSDSRQRAPKNAGHDLPMPFCCFCSQLAAGGWRAEPRPLQGERL
jgi:hypothetical protein